MSNELILAGLLQLKKLQKTQPEKYSGLDGAWTCGSRIAQLGALPTELRSHMLGSIRY